MMPMVLRYVLTAFMVLIWAWPGYAQTQSTPAATCATADGASKLCAQIHPMHFDDLTLAQINTLLPKAPSDDVPWIAQSGVAPPLAINPAEAGVGVRTSVGQWRDFNSAMLTRRIDAASALKPSALVMPKPPVVPALPLDVWSSFDVQGLAHDADETTKTGVGAKYKLTSRTNIGIEAQRADQRSAGGVGLNKSDKLAANLTYQASPLLSFDASTEWETGSVVATTGNAKTDKSSLLLAPKLKYPIAVGGGQTFEPFVTMREDLALSVSGVEGAKKNTLSVGTGLTLSKPQTYSLSVTTDLENVGAVEPTTVKSRLQLSVPLR